MPLASLGLCGGSPQEGARSSHTPPTHGDHSLCHAELLAPQFAHSHVPGPGRERRELRARGPCWPSLASKQVGSGTAAPGPS